MLQYQKKFGLIRRKKPICTPSAVSVRPLRLLRSLGLSCLFLTFSSFFSAPRWEENGGRELLRGLAPPGVAGPWERAPQGNLGWNLQAPELRSRGTSLGRTVSEEGRGFCPGQGLKAARRSVSLCPSEPHQPSLFGWMLCELPQRPWLAPNHKFSPT
ncbi:unnamed protein product [Rangifer tarandus platyrhynchus]|uniref:Uncharacterized protein n=1 Tax=Rangifer tarandus platyrhynchus TaxID=3082113 RepID=A0AC59ZBW9_RANTA